MVTINEINYSIFGKCAVISNGKVEVYVTLEIGPRIIRYAICGKENMFWEDTQSEVTMADPQMDDFFFKGAKWHIYGGHRMWLSPQSRPGSYYPDNDPVEYEIIDGGIITRPKKQVTNQVQYEITITMEESGLVNVKHVVTNHNAYEIECAIWALSVTGKNGLHVIPVSQKDTVLLPNRTIILWPCTKLNDKRVYWGEKFISVKQDPNEDGAFKLGISNEDAYALHYNNDCLMVKTFDYHPDAIYPDGGVCYEAYSCREMLESESLGALVLLAPGESDEHNEYWMLYDNVEKPAFDDEAAFEADVNKYL